MFAPFVDCEQCNFWLAIILCLSALALASFSDVSLSEILLLQLSYSYCWVWVEFAWQLYPLFFCFRRKALYPSCGLTVQLFEVHPIPCENLQATPVASPCVLYSLDVITALQTVLLSFSTLFILRSAHQPSPTQMWGERSTCWTVSWLRVGQTAVLWE